MTRKEELEVKKLEAEIQLLGKATSRKEKLKARRLEAEIRLLEGPASRKESVVPKTRVGKYAIDLYYRGSRGVLFYSHGIH
jgi:hypothetical protein